ncbi:MAG: hypothetical protein WCA35_25320, partial [Kovacikia sp.]
IPLIIYLVNFAFGAIITVNQLDVHFWIPTGISVLLGVLPAIVLWQSAKAMAVESHPLAASPALTVLPKVLQSQSLREF